MRGGPLPAGNALQRLLRPKEVAALEVGARLHRAGTGMLLANRALHTLRCSSFQQAAQHAVAISIL
jgi:hypothetical protein